MIYMLIEISALYKVYYIVVFLQPESEMIIEGESHYFFKKMLHPWFFFCTIIVYLSIMVNKKCRQIE
jgi:hypothetical protein